MKVEIGKIYLTAEGRKAKVTHGNTQGILVAEVEGKSQSLGFSEDGKFLGDKTHHGNCDLIEEYKDETQPTPIAVREWGNISFDGKEETLDTSFSIMPHDMKIIGGYRIENVGSTPIYVSSEEQKTKDDTQMFKVGDRITWGSRNASYVIEAIDGDDVTFLEDSGEYLDPSEIGIPYARRASISLIGPHVEIISPTAPAPSSPVQSRKTLVPGVYGRLRVGETGLRNDEQTVSLFVSNFHTAQELREMIRVLGDIVEFLEEVG